VNAGIGIVNAGIGIVNAGIGVVNAGIGIVNARIGHREHLGAHAWYARGARGGRSRR
jgi:hypothetical protein